MITNERPGGMEKTRTWSPWIFSTLDRLAGASDRGPDLRRRILVGLVLLVVVWSPIYGLIFAYALDAAVPALFVLVAGLLGLPAFSILRRTRSNDLAGAWVVGVLALVLVALAGVLGGLSSPALYWLPICPLFAFLIVGRRAGLCWTAASLLILIAFAALDQWGLFPPSLLSASATTAYAGISLLTVTVLASSLALLYDVLHSAALDAEQAARAQSLAANEALRRARDAAEAGTRAKSEFLAHISHEIRTPLNGVIGLADLALDGAACPQQRGYLQTLTATAEHLRKVICDVLDLSKIEAGHLELEAISIRLPTIVEEACAFVAQSAADKGIELQKDVAAELALPRRGDPVRLKQVLVNLLGNAIKFTDKGHVRVSLRGMADPEVIEICVSDTGIGVAPERLERIFEAFSQADTSTTREFGGTGLGLTICAEMARKMGGRIWAESSVGEGSSFYVTLRLPIAEATAVSATPAQAPAQRRLKLLVAEDNAVNALVIRKMLQRLGHEVDVAVDGARALEVFERGDFDAVLMDVQMPRMDGLEATRLLRLAEREQHTPVVALTANATTEDRRRCLEAGMDDFITKPIDRKQLDRVLASIAGRPSPKLGEAAARATSA